MKRTPTQAFEHGTGPSAYARAWRMYREAQNWYCRELLRKNADAHRIIEARDFMLAAERTVLWIERNGRR